jgi:hypothetical protein
MPRNGVFYPRIQSILAYFLEIKKWRKWREVCESNVCMCYSPARAFSTRVVARRDRPPTSCRAFLIRTLPPPPTGSSRQQQHQNC